MKRYGILKFRLEQMTTTIVNRRRSNFECSIFWRWMPGNSDRSCNFRRTVAGVSLDDMQPFLYGCVVGSGGPGGGGPHLEVLVAGGLVEVDENPVFCTRGVVQWLRTVQGWSRVLKQLEFTSELVHGRHLKLIFKLEFWWIDDRISSNWQSQRFYGFSRNWA